MIYIVVLIDIYLFIEYFKLFSQKKNLEKKKEIEKISLLLEEAYNLTYSIRAKHHDFINHLQVIMGLSQLGNYEEVSVYIKNLSNELIEYEKLVSLKRPEVASLISSKIASLSYLRVNLDITTTLEEIDISPIHLVGILSNLLDKAIDEISTKDDKWIKIKIYEDINYSVFEITNPGTMPNKAQDRIFGLGCTAKDKKDRGTGLYITQKIVTDYNGELSVTQSKENELTFILKLPNRKRALKEKFHLNTVKNLNTKMI
ncbi:MAG: sensor histidine kinase [Bacillota bacterium]